MSEELIGSLNFFNQGYLAGYQQALKDSLKLFEKMIEKKNKEFDDFEKDHHMKDVKT